MSVAANKWSYVFDEPTRILMVDDDPILHEFASVYLTTPFSQVVSAADGAEALDLLSRETFDIALFDIEMPGMDGFELVQRVRQQEKLRNLPVVIVTGREDITSIDRAYAAGATSFTTKPINWRQLSYQLRYVIRANRCEVGAPQRDHGGAVVSPMAGAPMAMSSTTRHQFATALSSIINAANLIAAGRAQGREAAQARDIATAAEALLRKFLGTAEGAESRHSLAVVPSDTRRLVS